MQCFKKEKKKVMGCCYTRNAANDDFQKILDDGENSSEEGSDFECPICMGSSSKKVCLTPCNHLFHIKCLTAWKQKHPNHHTCPTCRCELK